MILIKLLLLPVRLVFFVIGLLLKIEFKIIKIIKIRRIIVLAIGALIGACITPFTGAETRERIRKQIDGASASTPDDLAERVRFELSHSPRTWHLPQPEVGLVGGVVTLSGTVPHAAGKDELAAQAASVPGVSSVNNVLVVQDEPSTSA